MPTLNEIERLPATLRALVEYQASRALSIEVIIADDGSSDGTRSFARSFPAPFPIEVVSASHVRGPGAATKAGVAIARGDQVLFSDADGPVPFSEADRLRAKLNGGCDVVAGSRVVDHARLLVAQPVHRVWMGRIWRRCAEAAVPTGVRDTQCGFKLFTRRAAKHIFRGLQSAGFGFHVEALWRAQKLGYRVEEVPVYWSDVEGSKIRILRDPLHMLAELTAVAAKDKLGGRVQ